MALIDAMLEELEEEAKTTRRVLERVPQDKLDWRPHPKGRTLGELAMHVAIVPGAVAEFVTQPSPAQVPTFQDPTVQKASDLVPELDRGIATAKRLFGGMDDAELNAEWKLLDGDRVLFATTRAALARTLMLNHWYHHRGQLTAYLRATGVAIPSIYGPSADENPFAAAAPSSRGTSG